MNMKAESMQIMKYLKPTILAVTSVDSKKTKAYSGHFWKLKQFPDKKSLGFSTTDIVNKCRS